MHVDIFIVPYQKYIYHIKPISLIALSWNQFYFKKNYDFVSIISYDRKIETTTPMHKKRKEKKKRKGNV
jgi:hypothetical protein